MVRSHSDDGIHRGRTARPPVGLYLITGEFAACTSALSSAPCPGLPALSLLPVQKGAEKAESAPFWIRHRPSRAFQHFRAVQKGAKNAESAPFWICHRLPRAFQHFRAVQKGAEKAESAPFWIWHRPPRAFQHFRSVQKGAKKAESAPFWICHLPPRTFQHFRAVQKGAKKAESAPFRILLKVRLCPPRWLALLFPSPRTQNRGFCARKTRGMAGPSARCHWIWRFLVTPCEEGLRRGGCGAVEAARCHWIWRFPVTPRR